VNDDPPEITAKDNEILLATNAPKKEALKVKKANLAEKWMDIQRLAPLVEQGASHIHSSKLHIPSGADYQRAKNVTNEALALAKSDFDTRLDLFRLRQAYPQPRHTIASADEALADQISEMHELEDQQQQGAQRVARMKESFKDTVKEVDRLRIERAELERQLREQSRTDGDDDAVAGLYDWCAAPNFSRCLLILYTLSGTRTLSLCTILFSAWPPCTLLQRTSFD
jgi:hypothetical protein